MSELVVDAPADTTPDTDAATDGAAVTGVDIRPDVTALAEGFIGFLRTFNRARSRMLEATAHDVEWSAHVVLKCLQHEGPMRAGSLAECVMSDPSTVSRQVAALVKDGLLERRADPDDGRASLLVLTPRAHEVLAEHDGIRLQFFAEMLSAWTPGELRDFARLLGRFADDFSHTNHEWVRAQIVASTRVASTPKEGTY